MELKIHLSSWSLMAAFQVKEMKLEVEEDPHILVVLQSGEKVSLSLSLSLSLSYSFSFSVCMCVLSPPSALAGAPAPHPAGQLQGRVGRRQVRAQGFYLI